MKKVFLLLGILAGLISSAQEGYEIQVSFKPFKNQYIYLGHYFGKQYPIIDSVKLDHEGFGVFKGPKKLQGGIYLVGYPNKSGFFEMLLDKQQRFSIIADTVAGKEIVFKNSEDNNLFKSYQKYMSAAGREINEYQQKLKGAKNAEDSARYKAALLKADKTINKYRDEFIKDNPNAMLSALLISMREPILEGRLKEPKTRQDSIDAYEYFKKHFWDGVNFWDGRLAYTTFFEDKLDKYFNQLVTPHPDSIIKEIDYMLGYASANEEMNRFLLIKFVNRYLVQKYMWEDAVFVHLFEKYFAQKNYSWLTETGRKTITDRAYNLMSNIMGTPAEEIILPDSTGKSQSLYDLKSNFTLVTFWDPKCGHCREVLPKLDSFYRAKWKAEGLTMYAVAKETDGNRSDWMKFVHEQHIDDWEHVYYSKEEDHARVNAGIPSYSQLYDVQTFPTLYLLDKDKRIVAKKLTYQQIDEVLQLKLKGE